MAKTERFIQLDSFNIGQRIDCVFVAPDKGRCVITLLTESDDVPLIHSVRYDWQNPHGKVFKNTFLLNTQINGVWGSPELHGGYDFTDGILVNVKIVAAESGFEIYCNGKMITTFIYRSGLSPTAVKKVKWFFEDNGASVMPQLKTLGVGYTK